jgi:2-polyprenyl-3-methyl-5-hydroxy-6-metoxy-1,4-benzoquinol methylase
MAGTLCELPSKFAVDQFLMSTFRHAACIHPSDYREGTFDMIYAYSVFSHLSEQCHLAWASEFARILKPGGTVCLTTQARNLKFAAITLREAQD